MVPAVAAAPIETSSGGRRQAIADRAVATSVALVSYPVVDVMMHHLLTGEGFPASTSANAGRHVLRHVRLFPIVVPLCELDCRPILDDQDT